VKAAILGFPTAPLTWLGEASIVEPVRRIFGQQKTKKCPNSTKSKFGSVDRFLDIFNTNFEEFKCVRLGL